MRTALLAELQQGRSLQEKLNMARLLFEMSSKSRLEERVSDLEKTLGELLTSLTGLARLLAPEKPD